MREKLSQNKATFRLKRPLGPFHHWHCRDRGRDGKSPLLLYQNQINNHSREQNVGQDLRSEYQKLHTINFLLGCSYPVCTTIASLYENCENFVRSDMKKTVKEQHILVKADVVPSLKLSDSWPQPPSLSSSSDKEACKIYCRACCKAQSRNENYSKKDREIRDRY